ncbi:MAG: ABC transporter ATP-binding protein, partial [Rubrivivax sp.]
MLRDDTLAAVALLARGADRGVRWRLGLAALLAVASGALAALAPLALKDLIDTLTARPARGNGKWALLWGFAPSDLASVGALAAAYLGCQCAVRMLAEARPVLMNAAEQRLYADLRGRYLQQLLSLPLQFHLDRRAGELLQEFQQATTGYQVILFHLVNSVVPIVVEACAVMLILMSLRQPALTGVIALTALAYLLVTGWRTDALRATAAAVTAASADVQAQLAEGLLHVEPIKVFGAERRTVAGVRRASDALHDAWARLQRERMRRGVALIAVFGSAMAAALLLSLRAVVDGSLTLGGFVLSNLYLLQVVRPLEALSGAVRDVHQALAFVKPLMTIMAMPAASVAPVVSADTAKTAPTTAAPAISVACVRCTAPT